MMAPVTLADLMDTMAVVPIHVAMMMPVPAMAVMAPGFCFVGCENHGTCHHTSQDQ
jgi:hypothetical protein